MRESQRWNLEDEWNACHHHTHSIGDCMKKEKFSSPPCIYAIPISSAFASHIFNKIIMQKPACVHRYRERVFKTFAVRFTEKRYVPTTRLWWRTMFQYWIQLFDRPWIMNRGSKLCRISEFCTVAKMTWNVNASRVTARLAHVHQFASLPFGPSQKPEWWAWETRWNVKKKQFHETRIFTSRVLSKLCYRVRISQKQ